MFLILTDPKPYDLAAFAEMNQDKSLQNEFLNLRGQTVEEAKNSLESIIRARNEDGLFDFAFIKLAKEPSKSDRYDSTNSKMVGFIMLGEAGFSDYARTGFKMLLNFGLIGKYTGKGLMTNALLMRFEKYIEAEINFVAAYIKGDNPASERVLRKCGFVRIDDDMLGSTFVKNMCMSTLDFNAAFKQV